MQTSLTSFFKRPLEGTSTEPEKRIKSDDSPKDEGVSPIQSAPGDSLFGFPISPHWLPPILSELSKGSTEKLQKFSESLFHSNSKFFPLRENVLTRAP